MSDDDFEIDLTSQKPKDLNVNQHPQQESEITTDTKFVRRKFRSFGQGVELDEVIARYACAADIKILLQGMLYLTKTCLYFYSPFNNKTVIGSGTKLKIALIAINEIKMKRNLLLFPTRVKIYLETGQKISFSGLASQQSCYKAITAQMKETRAQSAI